MATNSLQLFSFISFRSETFCSYEDPALFVRIFYFKTHIIEESRRKKPGSIILTPQSYDRNKFLETKVEHDQHEHTQHEPRERTSTSASKKSLISCEEETLIHMREVQIEISDMIRMYTSMDEETLTEPFGAPPYKSWQAHLGRKWEGLVKQLCHRG